MINMLNSTSWDALPDAVLINVFSFLSGKDKFSASLACRRWSNTIRIPQVWQDHLFDFRCPGIIFSHNEERKNRKFIVGHSNLMKKVKMSLYAQNSVSFRGACFIFEILSGSSFVYVKKLQLCCIGLNGLYIADLSPSLVISKINRFLKSLSCPATNCGLTHIDLNECELDLDDTTLLIIAQHHKNLKVIRLQNYHFKKITPQGVMQVIANCRLLEQVEALCHCIDEDVLKSICRYSSNLKRLSVTYSDLFQPSESISSETWKFFNECFPHCVVELKLSAGEFNFDSVFYSALCSFIPVSQLNLNFLTVDFVKHLSAYFAFTLQKLIAKNISDEPGMEKYLRELMQICVKPCEFKLLCPLGLKLLERLKIKSNFSSH